MSANEKVINAKVFWKEDLILKRELDIVQINLGDLCNQACTHCHIEASPKGKLNMTDDTAQHILQKLISLNVNKIEFTGGAPEMNPNLKIFISKLALAGKHLTVRTNLTILENPDYHFYFDLYKRHRVKLVASLPSVFADATDKQRGQGVFESSINVLKKLNKIGYGTNGLSLDFVYNPVGEYLPPAQFQLEKEYKQILKDNHQIHFNNLATIVNSPITRYKNYLNSTGKYDEYLTMLKNNYNPATLDVIMCRNLITVDHEGYIYDCDFNLAAKIRVQGYENTKFWEIDFDNFKPQIAFDDHCYACTVNNGSSCHGVLLAEDKNLELNVNLEDQFEPVELHKFDVKENVKKYYGEEIQQTADLKTTACCTTEEIPEFVRKVLPLLHDEIKLKYYGCGTAIPPGIEGLKVLDVGCGTGRDSYVMAKLVGEKGFVCGIDMTEQQIQIAQKYEKDQHIRFGYKKANTRFINDYMENIGKYFQPGSLDLVISNCVINLAEDKEMVLKQIFDALKYGGEFYFSDVYVDRRLPEEIRKHHVLYGECLGGALYYKDFERISRKAGFSDPRVMSSREIEITDPKIQNLVGNAKFYSTTNRLWKLNGLEDACEDYGHIAIYKGGFPESLLKLQLDNEHIFEKNKPERVCGNTALMLSKTRLKDYFQVIGDFTEHFGLFEICGTSVSENGKNESGPNSCGCC